MPSATASGADATPNGTAKSRDHKQGNQERKYTIEQKAAVIRVRRCHPTAFYDILGLEEVRKTVTEVEIKKAYRKLSLLTHPDKNGFEGADEAFKMVARAFQILSDSDKKSRYDKFGGDPDNRFGASSSSGQSPFSGFSRTPGGSAQQGPTWGEEEISPEELFDRFFSGGMGGPFGPFGGGVFDTGPQFVFNLGGGPGFRVHQFGGARPRRRPREANDGDEQAQTSLSSTLAGLLPLLILFVLPLLSSLFTGDSTPSGPSFRFDTATPPHTLHRVTPRLKVNYFVNPNDIAEFSNRKLHQLDQRAEVQYVTKLRDECEIEQDKQRRLMNEAQGWFFQDVEKMNQAREIELRSCRKLDDMRVARGAY